jgi:hypothetical protein
VSAAAARRSVWRPRQELEDPVGTVTGGRRGRRSLTSSGGRCLGPYGEKRRKAYTQLFFFPDMSLCVTVDREQLIKASY